MNCQIKAADSWNAAYQLGRNYFQKGRFEKAIACFKQAIDINAERGEVYHDLGVALLLSRRFKEAAFCFEKAVALDGEMVSAWLNGGNTLCMLHRPDDAAHWFKKALQIKPDYADAYYNLGNIHKDRQEHDAALSCYQKAITLDATNAEAHNNSGTILIRYGRFQEALRSFETAMALKPDYHQAAYNAATTLQQLGNLEQALRFARKALKIKPDYQEPLALMVALLAQACDWDGLYEAETQLRQMTAQQLLKGHRPAEQPFLSFARSADPQHNFKVAATWANWLISKRQGEIIGFSHHHRIHPGQTITIGYLSEQFRNAATAHLMAGIFSRHCRKRFRIIAYSWGEDDGSAYRRNISRDVDEFVDIRTLPDKAAARRIYADEVDILVDLMGWMHGHRMGILHHRPAPIQVNYLGYPATSGAPFVDYILADPIIIPSDHRRYFSEKVVYLPHCYQVTDPAPFIDEHGISRAAMGLPEKGIVFCAFNTDYKIEPLSFGCWMQVLHAVPGSVLWLIARGALTRKNLREQAYLHGIDAQRLIFADPLPKSKHLARLQLADVALDTFTVNGHTTASDTLWAGVPLITLQGTHFASRVASSVLSAIGLNELVTQAAADYTRLAIELGSNPNRLVALKSKLKANKKTRPLFNTDRFVRSLEQAYSQMWRLYVGGESARSFCVADSPGLNEST